MHLGFFLSVAKKGAFVFHHKHISFFFCLLDRGVLDLPVHGKSYLAPQGMEIFLFSDIA